MKKAERKKFPSQSVRIFSDECGIFLICGFYRRIFKRIYSF